MNKEYTYGPLWAEVNLNNLIYNIRGIRKIVKEDTMITGVIKANAYGHGAVMFAKVLLENGADRLAVATIREAIELREAGIEAEILILGFTQDSDLQLVIDYDLIQAMYNLDQAKKLNNLAEKSNKKAKIHIKVDSGMSRIGYRDMDREIEEIIEISKLDDIYIEGIFTHFATADDRDKTFTEKQYSNYTNVVNKLEERGIKIPIKHVSNSAAIMDLPDYNLDMVRAGVILYGLYPSNEVMKENLDLKPVMTLKTKISHIKEVEPATGIGYGQTYHTEASSIIGTIPVGYADGYSRLLSNVGSVGIAGKRAKIVGRICMDQCMIDLTGIEGVQLEDEVVLFNDGSMGYPSLDELAGHIDTINYEIATLVGRRIPRVYILDNEVVDVVDYVVGNIAK